MIRAEGPRDELGQLLSIGDRIVIRAIPHDLIHDLPEQDKKAITSQIGNVLPISGFNKNGYVELEFVDSKGVIHTIWIEPACLKKE